MNSPKELVRTELVDRLRTELVGPNDDHEVLDESPADRYLSGILWPAGLAVEAEQIETGDQDGGADDESTGFEQTAPLAASMKPSSIGLSFLLEPGVNAIRVRAEWGLYAESKDGKQTRWARTPVKDDTTLTLKPGAGRQRQATGPDPTVYYETVTRVRPSDGRVAVSLFLINRKRRPEKGRDHGYCLYQPSLTILGLAPAVAPFEVRELTPPAGVERAADLIQDDLLYRHEKTFAVGHGTAVKWEVSPDHVDRALSLATITIPDYEVPRMIPLPWKGKGSLDMQVLADAIDGSAVVDYLTPLVEAYDEWIRDRIGDLQTNKDLPPKLRSRAEEHLKQCNRSLNRIRKGLYLIEDNPEVFEAFRFANRAMAWQRSQARWAQTSKKQKDWSAPPTPLKSEWRPFQIAFILQALEGVIEPTHEDRRVTDLLWFPTGGGKTEAYLGLSAFTMALRRLRGEQGGMRGDAGVTVIMRYTLRLLTIQQFQRASTLICAMEMLRKGDPGKWGTEPFRLGLWVGGGSTPNTFDDCEKALKPGYNDDGATPVQLVSCPWCGSPIDKKHFRAIPKQRRILISCSRADCDFNLLKNPEGIPAVVEDEEIYRLAPSLVIGTVDKFARVPWLAETQALFGKVLGHVQGWGFVTDGEEPTTTTNRQKTVPIEKFTDRRPLLPPDLIIQDELHLISGPLGTVVGAYETAIDLLCSRTVQGQHVAPKVIASTATIRRAEEQVKALFERRVAIFPPPGLTASDSFFAVEQSREQIPGRQYVGIFAPALSVKTALVRVYSVLLASVQAMQAAPADLDPYYTLVGYFNSLRELGGAVRLVEDDVRARMDTLANPKRNAKYRFVARSMQQDVPELTSRVDSRDIPKRLDELERVYIGKANPKEPPVDVVLASNMISVGVDVSRLGLMVVTGQPKTTAEYIQATSRVGREFPGLVFTVYNWARPRDLSHYERFSSYHAALYRYVEPISVTPFSSRARDRALPGTFVAMARHRGAGLAAREHAVRFKADDAAVQQLRVRVLDRAAYVVDANMVKDTARQLDGIANTWHKAAKNGGLTYDKGGKLATNLMYPLGDKKPKGIFGVPNSMRDVEAGVGLYLREGDE